MRVCVTGASGFLGRYVCRALMRRGHDVYGLDIGPSVSCGGWYEMDITQPLSPIRGLDAVVHLAAIANPRECDADPLKAFSVNVTGTHHVLKMAWEAGAKKVVFASTAHVYGVSPRYLPTDETHPLWLQNTYTLTKILGEQLCHLYFENHGLPYTTLRLFNAYGPEQKAGYFIPDMLAKGRTGSIQLTGGTTSKDWVYIDDVAQAFVLALTSPFVGPINIGTGRETTLSDIAHYLAMKMGVSCEETMGGDSTRMCADITRANRILGWTYTKGIYDGLIDTIQSSKPIPA